MSASLSPSESAPQNFSPHASLHLDIAPHNSSSENWNVYRTRFLVRARQLTEPLSFTDPLGREHHGIAGDYLVQSSEGLLRIASREIFEDIYQLLEREPEQESAARNLGSHLSANSLSEH